MKYTKISYQIIGRFPAGAKLSIVTKMNVEGYIAEGMEEVAIRKTSSGMWTLDHIATGMSIGSCCYSKKREDIAKAWTDTYKDQIEKMLTPEKLDNLKKRLAEAVSEEEAATYVMETYTTTSDHRYEAAEKAAKKAGLIVRRATDESYQRGGKMIFIGKAETVKEVLNMIKEREEKAAATMAEIEAKAATTEEATEVKAEAATAEAEAEAEATTTATAEAPEATATVEPAKDPEEVKADVMSEIEAGNFSVLLPMFAMRHDNAAAIMAAGIEAGAYSLADIKAYLTRGIMPAYHTFNEWKKAGYTVNKGEKAAFKAYIWKHIDAAADPEEAEAENADEAKEATPDFIRKVAFFFGINQVTKKEYKELNADGVTVETRGKYEIATGDTRAHKEELKAAGFTWNHKRGEWFRLAATATAGDGAKAPAPAVKVAAAAAKEKEADTSATSAPTVDIKRVFTEAVERIKTADLTDAQRNKLILEAGDKKIFAEAIAYMLETVAKAEGKVYDVNGKAALIGGKIREDWRGDKSAYAEGDFWRAYVNERYSWKEIKIYMKGNSTKEICIRIELKTEEGKKPRIDATKTAENMKASLTARLEEIEKIGLFAGNVKALEEKKAAVLAMIEDIKKSANAGLDTVRDFGLYAGYRTFEAARV